ncbi:hypothetical protein ACFWP2_27565 [Kitasatospora sp. NPDC058444]|uniref:hypothetical protein n=1 Tax=Kitasatospora sp. NPDC058444 TaxID=3346504 RepID=UPI003665DE09
MTGALVATPREAFETLPAGNRRFVRHTVDLLVERSRVLADAVEAGRAAVVGPSYRSTAPPTWSPPGASTYPSARWRDLAGQRSLRSGTTLRSWSALIAPARRSCWRFR